MAFVTTRDGRQLLVQVMGCGRPVLILHGPGADGRQWLPFVKPLLHKAKFYISDLRDVGGSASSDLSHEDLTHNHFEKVEDIVHHFKLLNVLLVGHSRGAIAALQWLHAGGFANTQAYMHIDQLPNVSNWKYGPFSRLRLEDFVILYRLEELLRPHLHLTRLDLLPPPVHAQVLELLAFSQMRQGYPLSALLFRNALRWPALIWLLPLKKPLELYRILIAYLEAKDLRECLSNCQIPVMVMAGMNSILFRMGGQKTIADYAPQCEIVCSRKPSLMLPFTDPFKFVPHLHQFVWR